MSGPRSVLGREASRRRGLALLATTGGVMLAVSAFAACSSSAASPATPGPDSGVTSLDGSSGESDASTPDGTDASYTETTLTLALALAVTYPDAGVEADGGEDADDEDAGTDAATDGGGPIATLTITARDGVTPLVTDLWLYTLDSGGTMTPLTGFTSTAARKTPRLMLPATIAGQPSGLSPADDGRLNGIMTNTNRGVLDQGAFVSTVNGTVVVTLPSIPTSPILVVAGVEDQRYAGAAAINADGTLGTVPSGVGMPESHTARSFTRDVAPILAAQCTSCHNPTGPDNAELYLVTGSRDDLVNDNFALKEQTQDCQTANPDGGEALAACIQAINKAQYLVEPGAPAVSDLLQRARPDEDAGTSALGLLWYGSKGNRYNTTYGDRRMPSTTQSTNSADWTNRPAYFDMNAAQFQVLYDWVAQGAPP